MARFQSRQQSSKSPEYKTSLDLNIWRIIGAKPHLCTLLEVQTVYSYADILDFHEYLNLREYLEECALAKAKQDSKKT